VKPAGARKGLGNAAEQAAALFLKSVGYTILDRNFSTRSGELDIIALDGKMLCFVEVRSRAGTDGAPPHATVNRAKQARVRTAASAYLAARRLHNPLCRFDVVSAVPDPAEKSGWSLRLFRDAF